MTEPNHEPLVLSDLREGVAVFTLNDPEKRNPLSKPMLEELSARLREAETDPAVRAVVIAHRGPAFSAPRRPPWPKFSGGRATRRARPPLHPFCSGFSQLIYDGSAAENTASETAAFLSSLLFDAQ